MEPEGLREQCPPASARAGHGRLAEQAVAEAHTRALAAVEELAGSGSA